VVVVVVVVVVVDVLEEGGTVEGVGTACSASVGS
jgi:hypothetical protein